MSTVSIVINCCYGGFGINDEINDIANELRKEDNLKYLDYSDHSLYFSRNIKARTDKYLIKAVKKYKAGFHSNENLNGFSCTKLFIKEIDSIYYNADAIEISEYDGFEGVKFDHYKVKMYRIQQIISGMEEHTDLEGTIKKISDIVYEE